MRRASVSHREVRATLRAAAMTPAGPPWRPLIAADAPPLGAHEVHVWWLSLQLSPASHAAMERMLPPHERAHLDIGAEPQHRWQEAARGLRRLLLAGYCGEPVAGLRFGTARLGKPQLLAPPGGRAEPLEFSFARRSDVAVLAIARTPVGVDIEHPLGDADAQEAAAAWLEPEERQALKGLLPAARTAAAASAWTALEARAKLHGAGLARMLDERGDVGSARRPERSLHRFVLEDGAAGIHLVGTLACAEDAPRIRYLRHVSA